MVNDWIRNAFAHIYRRVPGRYDALRKHLETATPQAAEEFGRLLQNYEHEIDRLDRKARMPWVR
jgi:hypothetical protein